MEKGSPAVNPNKLVLTLTRIPDPTVYELKLLHSDVSLDGGGNDIRVVRTTLTNPKSLSPESLIAEVNRLLALLS